MVSIDLREKSGVVLAYLGDSIWEVNVREHFFLKGYNLRHMNNEVVKYVNAKAQSKILNRILKNVEEKYKPLINRSKNGRIKSFPKTCTPQEYREATAFEAYIAALYLDGNIEEIRNIVKLNIDLEEKDGII
ncbi:ribonuclease III domain-containing protein [Fusobacterium sp. MFO224]|uniref:ribonuclease III domain-containing protein n=1 Tax=Fusobacterium sp. MFO224 TaxID=3378070 RepID=UPI0038542224